MAMNISCKFEKASYNIFFVRAVTVSERRRNEVKSMVSTGCYPVDTIICWKYLNQGSYCFLVIVVNT